MSGLIDEIAQAKERLRVLRERARVFNVKAESGADDWLHALADKPYSAFVVYPVLALAGIEVVRFLLWYLG